LTFFGLLDCKPRLTAHNLSKSFGPAITFSDRGLSVSQHARFGLAGPNGVGKTTRLRIPLGFAKPGASMARIQDIGAYPGGQSLESTPGCWCAAKMSHCLFGFVDILPYFLINVTGVRFGGIV
jgi:energy-coupling factor transporter ATP-binding protein EcfA2